MAIEILGTQIITANEPYCNETRDVNVRTGDIVKFQTFGTVSDSSPNLVVNGDFDDETGGIPDDWTSSGIEVQSGRACVQDDYDECLGAKDIEETVAQLFTFTSFVAPTTGNYTLTFTLSNYSIDAGSLEFSIQVNADPVIILQTYNEGANATSDVVEYSLSLTAGDTVAMGVSSDVDVFPGGDTIFQFSDACVNITLSVPVLSQVVTLDANSDYYFRFDKFGTGDLGVYIYNNIAGDYFVDDEISLTEEGEYYFRTNSETGYTILFEVLAGSCIDNVELYKMPVYDLELYDCDGDPIVTTPILTTFISGRTIQYWLDTSTLDNGCYYFVLTTSDEGEEDITTNHFCVCSESECDTRLKLTWDTEFNITFQDGKYIDHYNLDNEQTVYVDGAISKAYPSVDVSGYIDCLNGYNQNVGSLDFTYNVTLHKVPLHLALAIASATIHDTFTINGQRYIITESQELDPSEDSNLYIYSFSIKKYQYGLINN